jgi:hypothetical protein
MQQLLDCLVSMQDPRELGSSDRNCLPAKGTCARNRRATQSSTDPRDLRDGNRKLSGKVRLQVLDPCIHP